VAPGTYTVVVTQDTGDFAGVVKGTHEITVK